MTQETQTQLDSLTGVCRCLRCLWHSFALCGCGGDGKSAAWTDPADNNDPRWAARPHSKAYRRRRGSGDDPVCLKNANREDRVETPMVEGLNQEHRMLLHHDGLMDCPQ